MIWVYFTYKSMKNGQVHLKKGKGNSIYLHRIYVAILFLGWFIDVYKVIVYKFYGELSVLL